MSGSPVLHYLLEVAHIHVHRVSDASHLILCHPLLLLLSVFPSIRVFSHELSLWFRWTTYWSFSFSISPSSEYSGLFLLFCALTFCRVLFNIVQIYSNPFIMLTVLFPCIFISFLFPFYSLPSRLSLSLSHVHMSVFPSEMNPILITSEVTVTQRPAKVLWEGQQPITLNFIPTRCCPHPYYLDMVLKRPSV